MPLRDQCDKAGITLTRLAELANMRLTALSKVEHGRRHLTLREGNRIAKILGCEPEDLLTRLDTDAPLPIEAVEHGN